MFLKINRTITWTKDSSLLMHQLRHADIQSVFDHISKVHTEKDLCTSFIHWWLTKHVEVDSVSSPTDAIYVYIHYTAKVLDHPKKSYISIKKKRKFSIELCFNS